MDCYITTVTLQGPPGIVKIFVSLCAGESPDAAIDAASKSALEQQPGWTPLKGSAAIVDRDRLREIAHQVLGL